LQASYISQAIALVFLKGATLEDVQRLLAALLLVILLKAACIAVTEQASSSISRKIKCWLRINTAERLMAAGPVDPTGHVQDLDNHTGEITSVLAEGVEKLDSFYSQFLPQLILAAAVPLMILGFIFKLDPVSGFVLLFTAPLIPVFMYLIGSYANKLSQKQWRSLSRMSAYFLDVIQGLTTLRALGRSREQTSVIARFSDRFRNAAMRVLKVAFLSSFVLELAAALSTAVVAVQVGLRLLYGYISFEQALFVLILAPEFYQPLRMLGASFHNAVAGHAPAERIFNILDERSQSKPLLEQGRIGALNLSGKIRFDNVSFTYPEREGGLHKFSLELNPGEITAVSGPSGSGKTTLVNLLLRFIEPQQGSVYVGDQILADIPTEAWRDKIALVPQKPYLFHDTVLANIRLAYPEAEIEDVVNAAKQANAHQFIQALPEGYETVIGERGERLSAGQAQRIALARAFLKDSPIIILDEPTSRLDSENELQIMDALGRLVKDRTVILISHGSRSLSKADRVVSLRNGRLVSCSNTLNVQDKSSEEIIRIAEYQQEEDISSNRNSIRIDKQKQLLTAQTTALSSTKYRTAFQKLVFLLAHHKYQVGLSVVLGLATVLSSAGLMGTAAYLISRAALQPSIAELQLAIVGVRFFGIARAIFRYLERLTTHNLTFHLLKELRVWFYQAIEPLAPARLIFSHRADFLNRIMSDITALENFYIRAVSPPLVAGLVVLAAGFFLFSFHPLFAAVFMLGFLIAGAFLPLLVFIMSRKMGHNLAIANQHLYITIVDGIQGMPDLLAFGQAQQFISRLGTAQNKLLTAQKVASRINSFHSSLISLKSNLTMWVILLVGIYLVSSGQIAGVLLASIVLIALTSFEAAVPLSTSAQYLENSLVSARRLFSVTETRPEAPPPIDPEPAPQTFSIKVENLHFRYHKNFGEDLSYTLEDINFELQEGKRLAVVGRSGSGKTTLANLLLRFWEYGPAAGGRGRILLNDCDLGCYCPDDLRKKIGVVSQTNYIFTATIRDNILLARPDSSEEALVNAAKTAQIHDFISSLPLGYDTWLGEDGVNLSGGERQRIAVARAVLKDPPFLILDEACHNLDAETEKKLLEALLALMEGRPILHITHRLVGMEMMDEILVLENGCIPERGSHFDLIRGNGVYRRLWESQNYIITAAQ
jgi:ATP-binding cassette, subfamily C, bacterial CydCD